MPTLPARTRPPASPGFVHLHLHSEYSLLDGGNKISRLIDRVKELGMSAVAITDHGNLHAAAELYAKATAAGVKPILGIEAYVAPGDRTEKKTTGIADGGFHLVLLAENQTGWRNLLKLSSDAFINGFYYRPRMDKTTLAQWSDGLIAINGHLGSSLAHHLLQYVQTRNEDHYRAAIEEARWHAETFGVNEHGQPCFFVELQRHSVQEQQRINPELIRLARELGLPLVCDNDAHFLRAQDHDVHDSLCCISMQKTKNDPSRLKYSADLYVKSPQEMAAQFSDLPEAVENTVSIADRCQVELDFSASHAPVVRIVSACELPLTPEGAGQLARSFQCAHPIASTEWYKAFCSQFRLEPYDREKDCESAEELKRQCDGALRALAEAGAIWRYGPDGVDGDKRARLDRELKILADKLISAYFLICWDFVSWARTRDIPANARGSGVGTMVGYVLGLSNACPVRYGLLFERFTDPDRSEYPDIDIDICQDGRAAVINYVREKYGYVAQIITFGRLKARQAIKDVARVNGLTATQGQRLANLVPAELNITIDAALEREPDLKAEYEQDPTVRSVIDTARALEDHARHAGVHAAGVVVATQPLENIVPLCRATGSEDTVTQWDGPTCEKVGLLKMDFLGLRTLSTIELAKKLIRETLDEEAIARSVAGSEADVAQAAGHVGAGSAADAMDLERITYDDQKVLDLFRRADTSGIFQFESGGMRKLLQEMKPDRLEDLIAANALFRPGPMDLIDEYCMRKHGRIAVPRIHGIVDEHTGETYGIMVYQEQVMQIVHGLGDIPLRQAYTLIKAISKKKHDVIDSARPKFIEGAAAKGLSERQANELFDLILKFAGYGFNKSHSTGYAIIAYQTAYLKAYFPAHYMAAVLTYESSARKTEDWAPYLHDCARTRWPDHCPERAHIGIEVKPPDLNLSRADFAVVFEPEESSDNCHGHIRFGLGAIRGVGRSAIAGIIEERDRNGPFSSLVDFCERLSSRVATKAVVEALVKSGALDSLHGREKRAALCAVIDDAIAAGQQAAEDRRCGQLSIFGDTEESASPQERPQRPLPNIDEWDRLTMLEAEKATLGFHVSGHPLDQFEGQLRAFTNADTSSAAEAPEGRELVLGGILSRVRITLVRNGRSAGEKMAMITLHDKLGSIEGVVFSEVFAREAPALQEGQLVLVSGRIDRKRGSPQIIVDRVVRMEEAAQRLGSLLELTFVDDEDEKSVESQMQLVAGVLKQASTLPSSNGARHVDIAISLYTGGKRICLKPHRLRVIPETRLLNRLAEIVGPSRLCIRGGN